MYQSDGYYSGSGSCVNCPPGLQLMAPNSVGGSLATCVLADWDVVIIAVCGSCLFWRAAGDKRPAEDGNMRAAMLGAGLCISSK